MCSSHAAAHGLRRRHRAGARHLLGGTTDGSDRAEVVEVGGGSPPTAPEQPIRGRGLAQCCCHRAAVWTLAPVASPSVEATAMRSAQTSAIGVSRKRPPEPPTARPPETLSRSASEISAVATGDARFTAWFPSNRHFGTAEFARFTKTGILSGDLRHAQDQSTSTKARPAVRGSTGAHCERRLHRCDSAVTEHTDSFTGPASSLHPRRLPTIPKTDTLAPRPPNTVWSRLLFRFRTACQ